MAINHVDIVDIDLDSGTVFRSFANRTVGEGDILANRFGVRMFRNGEAVPAGGSQCMGYFIRHGNGDTVTISGGIFNTNTVFVDLPEACYAYEGGFTLVIKLVGGGVTGTMRIVDGTVVDSLLGSPVDPGSVIPSLADLNAVIGQAETAANTIAGISISTEQVAGDNYRIIVTKS